MGVEAWVWGFQGKDVDTPERFSALVGSISPIMLKRRIFFRPEISATRIMGSYTTLPLSTNMCTLVGTYLGLLGGCGSGLGCTFGIRTRINKDGV